MKKYVKCVLSVYGFHNWENADDDVAYLASRHRHKFEIACWFSVIKNDRQIEFIQSEKEIVLWLLKEYGIKEKAGTRFGAVLECDFGGMSCEDIAERILTTFGAEIVSVSEDGRGGAMIVR